MTDTTEIADRLHGERDALTTTDVDDGLRQVRRIVRRRRRRNSIVGVAAAGGVLVAGVGAIGLIDTGPNEVVVTDTAPAVTTDAEPRAATETSTAPVTTNAPVADDAAPAPEPTVVVASVGETLAGVAVDNELVMVTEALRGAVGDEFFLDWQVPWNDGFLIGGQVAGTDSPAAYFSPDGRTWEAVEFDSGIDFSSQDRVTVADGRLIMLGTRGDWTQPTPVVASTTDLTNWTVEDIPIEMPPGDLPDTVQAVTSPRTISANPGGWIVTIDKSVMINGSELAKQHTGDAVASVKEVWSDEGILLTIDPDTDGVEPQDVWVPWSELEDDIGVELTDAVRHGAPAEVWTGTWDGEAPVRVGDLATELVNNSFEPPVAIANGFVIARTTRELPDDGPPVDSTELFASVERGEWELLEAPVPQRFVYAFPLDGDLGVVAETENGTISVYRVDVVANVWTPIEVPGLPTTTRFVQTSDTSVIDLDAAPPDDFENSPSTQTFEQNGLRLSWAYDSYLSTYEVTSIDLGELVVAESIDIRDVEGSFDLAFEHLTGGFAMDITITDPETGDVLMNITTEELAAANPQEPSTGSDPEPWIVATDDGISWFVYEVPPRISDSDLYYQEAMTVSGGRLLYVNDAREWFVVDLN